MITDETEVQQIVEKFPFLSGIKYRDQWLIGIIQNIESQFIWMYDINQIKEPELKKQFLSHGNDWYTQSDMETPINMFMKSLFDPYEYILKGYNKREVGEDIIGHQVNLEETFEKRTKKRKVDIRVRPVS